MTNKKGSGVITNGRFLFVHSNNNKNFEEKMKQMKVIHKKEQENVSCNDDIEMLEDDVLL